MDDKDARFNRRLAWFVFSSFIIFAAAVVLRVGIGATPYETTDGAGHPMGFNDPLHAGHYLIMVRNFNPVELLKPEYAYEWILLAAHVLGAWILLSCGAVCSRGARWFFAGQAVLFPIGLPGLIFLPVLLVPFFTGSMDREGFVDLPFIMAITQPVWVFTSLYIAFRLRGKSLGVSRGSRACVRAIRAAMGTNHENP